MSDPTESFAPPFQISLEGIQIEPPKEAPPPKRILLKASKLVKQYGGKPVVNGLSFHLSEGEVVGLLGPNGAGKTTAFYMTIGLIRPDSGEVFFKDQNITSLPIHKRAQLGFGYLAQEPSIFRSLTVEENILCILETLPVPNR